MSLMSSNIAAYRNACSMPIHLISTAHPVKWLLNVAPPTALFTSGLLNPELMMILFISFCLEVHLQLLNYHFERLQIKALR